ncbi:hypothetical protein DFH08DRAFT_815763 [Mycena albidolilacea]|uniref:Uncharacterized protein n=1 Tax=Mycena albidolilacea TaxID=1033008 RepID=A0AAD6ZLD5_9AGAR|nr:hypothetical protein DFH08DRAFT_815763 [Mycena albidolilacea]
MYMLCGPYLLILILSVQPPGGGVAPPLSGLVRSHKRTLIHLNLAQRAGANHRRLYLFKIITRMVPLRLRHSTEGPGNPPRMIQLASASLKVEDDFHDLRRFVGQWAVHCITKDVPSTYIGCCTAERRGVGGSSHETTLPLRVPSPHHSSPCHSLTTGPSQPHLHPHRQRIDSSSSSDNSGDDLLQFSDGEPPNGLEEEEEEDDPSGKGKRRVRSSGGSSPKWHKSFCREKQGQFILTKVPVFQAIPRCSLPSCTAMTRAEPKCRDRVCHDDGGRPTTRYTAMRRDEVSAATNCPKSDVTQLAGRTEPVDDVDSEMEADRGGLFPPSDRSRSAATPLAHPAPRRGLNARPASQLWGFIIAPKARDLRSLVKFTLSSALASFLVCKLDRWMKPNFMPAEGALSRTDTHSLSLARRADLHARRKMVCAAPNSGEEPLWHVVPEHKSGRERPQLTANGLNYGSSRAIYNSLVQSKVGISYPSGVIRARPICLLDTKYFGAGNMLDPFVNIDPKPVATL